MVDPRSLNTYATNNNGNAYKQAVHDAMLYLHPAQQFDTDDENDAYALLAMTHYAYNVPMGRCGGTHHLPDHNRAALSVSHGEWPYSQMGRAARTAVRLCFGPRDLRDFSRATTARVGVAP